jgi:hypothetical protein
VTTPAFGRCCPTCLCNRRRSIRPIQFHFSCPGCHCATSSQDPFLISLFCSSKTQSRNASK